MGKPVYTDTLDRLLENETPTTIKINAMVAGRYIILGGTKTLRRCKPTLILEFAVGKKDVYEMIKTIRSINPNYKFYMRKKKIFGDIKTILYCL